MYVFVQFYACFYLFSSCKTHVIEWKIGSRVPSWMYAQKSVQNEIGSANGRLKTVSISVWANSFKSACNTQVHRIGSSSCRECNRSFLKDMENMKGRRHMRALSKTSPLGFWIYIFKREQIGAAALSSQEWSDIYNKTNQFVCSIWVALGASHQSPGDLHQSQIQFHHSEHVAVAMPLKFIPL